MRAESGTGQTGRSLRMISIGTIVARAQDAKSYMFSGNHGGRKIISGGSTGTPRQSHCPNRASHILVNTRTRGTPPADSTHSRAFRIAGSSGETPASLSAK